MQARRSKFLEYQVMDDIIKSKCMCHGSITRNVYSDPAWLCLYIWTDRSTPIWLLHMWRHQSKSSWWAVCIWINIINNLLGLIYQPNFLSGLTAITIKMKADTNYCASLIHTSTHSPTLGLNWGLVRDRFVIGPPMAAVCVCVSAGLGLLATVGNGLGSGMFWRGRELGAVG